MSYFESFFSFFFRMAKHATIFNITEKRMLIRTSAMVYFLQLDVVTSFSWLQFILWESFRETSGQADVYLFIFFLSFLPDEIFLRVKTF